MTEELTVDGSLRNASTVDGEILLPSAWRIVVNDLRNDFLSHAAFSDDEHRKISRCHLQGDIESQFRSGGYADAAASLERAIRIQPKNPELWHVLADVRLRQQQSGLAEDLARKSNLLARDNAELVRGNWRIIGEACRLKGDASCAAEAMDKARY